LVLHVNYYNINDIKDNTGESIGDIYKKNPKRLSIEKKFNGLKIKRRYAFGVIQLYDTYLLDDIFQGVIISDSILLFL
jgi:hypothetical protein